MIARSLAVVMLIFAAVAEAADWRASLPAGWLVAIEAKDLATLEAGVAKLAAPWGRKTPPIGKTLAKLLPGVELTERPWGVALVLDNNGAPSPVGFLPTDDYEALCEALKADRASGVAVANVSGFDLALVDRDGWVQVGLLDAIRAGADSDLQETPEWSVQGDVKGVVSKDGLLYLAEGLRQRRQGQLSAGRGRIGPWRWPAGFDGYVDRFAPYAPVAAELATWGKPLEIAGSLTDDDLVLTGNLAETIELRHPEDATTTLTSEGAIGHVLLPHGLPPRLVELAIAWMKCRPDEIDAPEYPQAEWDDLAAAYRGLLSGYQSIGVLLLLPAEGDPVATNELVAFRWDANAASLDDALRLVTLRWNQLVDAADARMPLRLEMAPLEDAEGWRISTDLFKGFGLPRSPEVEAVFDRYYGGDVLSIEVTRRGESDEWLVSYQTPTADWLNSSPTKPATNGADDRPVLVEGEMRLDRWFAWLSMIDAIDKAGTLGYRPREPMAEAPAATLRITGGDSLRIDATLPMAAYENAVAHWRSSEPRKQP